MQKMETELGYCWDIHLTLELGEAMQDKNCQHRYFTALRTLELYDRVKATLAGDKKELVLIMCFHIVRKLHMTTSMLPEELICFSMRHCPHISRVTREMLWAVERAILNAVGNSLFPVKAAGAGPSAGECRICTGDPKVMDMWQYGSANPPLPPVVCMVQVGLFKVIARSKRDVEVMHHWDVMEVIMAVKDITYYMDCAFVLKPSSHVTAGALRDAHCKFTDMCSKDPVMAKLLSVHCRSSCDKVTRVLSREQFIAAQELPVVPVMVSFLTDSLELCSISDLPCKQETVEANRDSLMSLLCLSIEFFLAKWDKEVDNILKFVELDGTQGCITEQREWEDLEASLKENTENAGHLVKLFKSNWNIADRCSVNSRALHAKMLVTSAKAMLSMERSSNKSMEALRESRRKTSLSALRPSPTSSVATLAQFASQSVTGAASGGKRPRVGTK